MKKRRKPKMNYSRYRSRYIRRRRLNVKRIVICVVCLCVLISAAVGGILASQSKNNEVREAMVTPAYVQGETKDYNEAQSVPEATTKAEKVDVTLIAVGDDLVSDAVLYTAKKSDGSYDFSSVYEKMKPDIKKADIAILNQETILGGDGFEYQGYPCFNTPDSMGDAIIDAGFDIVQQASNHSYDTGVEGIEHCIKYWKKHKKKVLMVGLNKDENQYNTIPVYECKGIKFAVLNYTYGLNGFSLPQGKEYLVNLLDDAHWDKVKSDIEKAEETADFTIVLPHWGQEYVQPDPTEEQVKWAEMMVESGADLIIGTHPHVVEKIQWITAENGNQALCYYSLGNYTSGQQSWKTLLGGMAKLTIRKDEKGIRILKKKAGVVPIVTHYVWGLSAGVIREQYTYKLSDYSQDILNRHSIQWYDPVSYNDLEQLAKDVFGDWILKK